MKKKILLLMLGALFSLPAFTQDFSIEYSWGTLNFTITDEDAKECKVSSSENISGDVEIPKDVTYLKNGNDEGELYRITQIGEEAFSECSDMTSVAIPSSVTSIGEGAFNCCTGLTSVALPESITSIERFTFHWCSGLTSVIIPASVASVEDYAFNFCGGMTSVTIPMGVKSIGEFTFNECNSLTSVTIPASVTSIFYSSFACCSNLKEILVEEGNKHYCSDNGVVYDIDKTTLIECPGGIKEYSIPEGVKNIGELAFFGCTGLTSVIIPEGVKSIDFGAFTECSGLTTVTIPGSVTSIEMSAFHRCSGLTSVTIPEGVESIGYGAFYWCSSLTSVIIPESVTEIGDSAFSLCSSLNSVTYLSDQPIEGNSDIFDLTTYDTATLYMSEAGKDVSKDIDPWKNFKNVKVYDPASIEDNIADFNEDALCEVFNLNGVKIADSTDNLPAGIYVVRQGKTAKKIAVK